MKASTVIVAVIFAVANGAITKKARHLDNYATQTVNFKANPIKQLHIF